MSDWIPLLAGAALAALAAPGALRSFADNGWTRANHRGSALPFPGGAIAAAAGILAFGALSALDRLAGTDLLGLEADSLSRGKAVAGQGGAAVSAAWLCTGVALLGAFDDLLEAPPRGWRGHAAAVLRGRFSTGALKGAGTLALAFAVLSGHDDYLLAVAVLVLATNAFNLLDLRPGRSGKAFVVLAAGLLVASGETAPLQPLGAFAGPLLVLAAFDLREKTMLGDTGSNVLGALAGLWLTWVLDTTGLALAFAALLAINAYGEFRSISAAIDGIAPLRALDRLGRPADPPRARLH